MDSLILRTATQFLLPLLLLFSIFLLIRGHNEPGGGFVGGLVAAAAVALYAIAYDVAASRRVLRISSQSLVAVGLLLALTSGLWAVAAGQPFFTGLWTTVSVYELGKLYVGTPLLFDLGVYLVVVGVTLTVVLSLLEESEGRTGL